MGTAASCSASGSSASFEGDWSLGNRDRCRCLHGGGLQLRGWIDLSFTTTAEQPGQPAVHPSLKVGNHRASVNEQPCQIPFPSRGKSQV
jgi:hypothetical protein